MSTNPMQRIADLEAQVASLSAENASLKTRPNGNGHLELVEAVGLRVDRAGQLLREDFTGKLAALISPYIDSTVRRCAEVEKQQGDLEKKFEEHRKAVASSAAQMDEAFVKMRKEAAKDWKAQRDRIQDDFGRVDEFVRWFTAELEKNGKESAGAVASCHAAARACKDLTEKVSVPVEQTVERLGKIEAQGEKVITHAAQQLTKAYGNLREPVLWRATVLICATIFVHLAFAGFTVWGARRVINTNWQELTAHSERQKQEMKALLDKTLEEQKEAQIDREIKVKMWDELMKSGTPQQRQELLGKLRDQVHKAEEDRLGDQMRSGYDQMYGKKK